MSESFPKPKLFGGNVKVEFMQQKQILKKVTGVDTSDFAKTAELARLK